MNDQKRKTWGWRLKTGDGNDSISVLSLAFLKTDMIYPYYFLFFTLIFTRFKASARSSQFYRFSDETYSCECGKYNDLSVRIVGGKETHPHEYPWMVGIFHNEILSCGGSLINDRYVLTAGHCLKWSKKKNLLVVAGLHDRVLLEGLRKGGTLLEIDEILVHENFTSDSLHDKQDIGLIRLKYPVKFTEKIWPVCLPTKDEFYSKKLAEVTGWGKVSQKGGTSRFLRGANVEVLSNGYCNNIDSVKLYVDDSMLCAYSFKSDACQGDSGGPLIIKRDDGRAEQIGIVSWGIGCAEPGIPGVYTRITSFKNWIAVHTKDAFYCKNTA